MFRLTYILALCQWETFCSKIQALNWSKHILGLVGQPDKSWYKYACRHTETETTGKIACNGGLNQSQESHVPTLLQT